jgi:hypothetical protein
MLAAERRLGGSSAPFSQTPILDAPADSVRREICAVSGLAATDACPLRRLEWVAAGEPLLPCSWHHESEEGVLTFWPPEYRQWARAQGLEDGADVLSRAPAVAAVVHTRSTDGRRSPTSALTIVSPPDGATYSIDPTLRREFQTVPLRAAAAVRGPIEWSVDGRVMGSSDANGSIDWMLVPGEHHVVGRDRDGRTAEAVVTVR